MSLAKYKKFLKAKEEARENSSENGGSFKKDYTPFFNPNKVFKKIKKDMFFVRVLPNENGMFFFQCKKHQFKVGSTWKNTLCPLSRDSSGKTLSNSCPFCEFLEENSRNIDKEAVYALRAKDSYVILVFNPYDDELQKYEVNDYGLTDILSALQKIGNDEFDPDAEGFNLVFKKDTKTGYSVVEGVFEPEETVQDLMKKSSKFKSMVSLEKEVLPEMNSFIEKALTSSFNFALSAFAPTFAPNKSKKNKEESHDDEDDDDIIESSYDPNDDEEEDESFFKGIKKDKVEKKEPKNKKPKFEVEDFSETEEDSSEENDDEDIKIDDIRSFLEKRKK